jgi:hypothetical protein
MLILSSFIGFYSRVGVSMGGWADSDLDGFPNGMAVEIFPFGHSLFKPSHLMGIGQAMGVPIRPVP